MPPDPAARPSRAEARASAALTVACCLLFAWQLAQRLPPRPRAVAWSQPPITVAIDGAVAAPGSYTLPFGATVDDLVAAAGGLRPLADASLLNPAAPLGDGDLVRVARTVTARGDERIDLNHATPAELEALPGIGPALAGRIVAGRPYAAVDDLLRVRGIGPATLERLRPLATLD